MSVDIHDGVEQVDPDVDHDDDDDDDDEDDCDIKNSIFSRTKTKKFAKKSWDT